MKVITQQDEAVHVEPILEDDSYYELRIIELRNAAQELARSADHKPATLSLLNHTLDLTTSLRFFGVAIGTVPTSAILFRMLVLDSSPNPAVLLLAILATTVTGLVGYLTAGATARTLERILEGSFIRSVLLVPLLGITWGIVSGAAGGLFLFVIGAIVGGVIGGMVAGATLPLFAVIYSLIAEDGEIPLKRLFPLAGGISGSAAAFFLGA